MKRFFSSAVFLLLLVSFLSAGATGCAVLTKSQVDEVGKFAEASKNYDQLPGTLVNSYAEISRDKALLNIANMYMGEEDEEGRVHTAKSIEAWETLAKAYRSEQDAIKAGKQMDDALSILKDYSEILTKLVSDEYTDALGESVARLAGSMDKAIERYNETYSPTRPIEAKGGIIAEVVRAAGGIYIRYKQQKILRETVKQAKPFIDELMDEVKLIADNKKEDFVYLEGKLKEKTKYLANKNKTLTVDEIAFIYNDYRRIQDAIKLSEAVSNASVQYKAAHDMLVEKTKIKMDLEDAIAEINALKKEVEAGAKLKKQIEE